MGNKSSRGTDFRESSAFGSSASSWSTRHGNWQSPYFPQNQNYPPQQNYVSQFSGAQRRLERRYSRIADNYNSLEQVTEALKEAGLESSNLIVGIDFTRSNEWKGERSFNRRSLHHIGDSQNPYEQAISIIGRTLAPFDEDNLIPCFGFGDASTHDQDVFSFYPNERLCKGFEEALMRYKEIVPHLRLAGPTAFTPIIEMAMTIVEQRGGQYHVLLIIADGQITRSVDTQHGQLSPQEQDAIEAIVKASKLPLSIILVGVGDGPWDMMREFEDNIPNRDFDNFQFVNFTDIMSKNVPVSKRETEFALEALMEIPSQYKATVELNIFGSWRGKAPERVPLRPPFYSIGFKLRAPSFDESESSESTSPASSSTFDNQVIEALQQAGLESSNLIVGIDFTKSNEWTGARSFNRRSLHHIGDTQNPYEQAISIIGSTLSTFDEDNLIPCFGFGDASTHDQDVFSFYPDKRPCKGLEEALSRYKEIVPHLRLAGPTSFAPIIEMAMTIVKQSGGRYHVLLIIADGQVTRSVDTEHSQLSPQEQKTIDAIVNASELPLSIILVGVGDGPWDMIRKFDDDLPSRAFDNFQFVNFTDIMSKDVPESRKQTDFARSALMKIPSQYKATRDLNIMDYWGWRSPERVPLLPPFNGEAFFSSKHPLSRRFQLSEHPYHGCETSVSTTPPSSSIFDNQICPICLTNPKDMAFLCGHRTCCDCGQDLELCPLCRKPIEGRIKLYN